MEWLHPRNTSGKAAWLAIAITCVAAFEGFYGHSYRDIAGVQTICYGQTAADGADFSKVYTEAECKQMLGTDLQKYDAMVRSCVHVAMPPHREAAMVSFTYNLGKGALCHGPVARNLNAGNVAGACRAILGYDHARVHGELVVVRGLTRRRQAEYKLCMMDN